MRREEGGRSLLKGSAIIKSQAVSSREGKGLEKEDLF